MNLSPNFTLEEFIHSDTGIKLGIDNKPNAIQIENMKALCDVVLEPLRAHFNSPIRILSGFRNQALNKAVGGVSTSQHTLGEAADITIRGVKNSDLWLFISLNLNYDQVIAEKLREDNGEAGWVHVSHKQYGKQRAEALSFLGHGKYVKGLQYV